MGFAQNDPFSHNIITFNGRDVRITAESRSISFIPLLNSRSTILVVLDTKGTRLHYVPGDHVAIYPQYNAKLVSELLDRLTLPCSPDDPIYVECRREPSLGGLPTWSEERRLPVPITLREAFTYYLDITTPPTPQFLKLLAQQATKMTDQEELLTLAKGGNEYEDWKYDRFPNLIDVMNQFHSLKIDITLLLQQLPLLQCVSGHPLFPFLFTSCVWFEWFCFPSPQRYYSISSSPRMHPGEVHATVAIVSFRKRGIYPNSKVLSLFAHSSPSLTSPAVHRWYWAKAPWCLLHMAQSYRTWDCCAVLYQEVRTL